MGRRLYANLFERLLANSVESETYFFEETPCWEWTGRIAKCYPRMNVREGGRLRCLLAHRAMAELVVGRVLDSHRETIEHRCELPWCINFLHFALASRGDNTRDARARRTGRARLEFKPLVDLDLYSVDRLIRSLPVLKTDLMDPVCPF